VGGSQPVWRSLLLPCSGVPGQNRCPGGRTGKYGGRPPPRALPLYLTLYQGCVDLSDIVEKRHCWSTSIFAAVFIDLKLLEGLRDPVLS
jgi:hypothetical protein